MESGYIRIKLTMSDALVSLLRLAKFGVSLDTKVKLPGQSGCISGSGLQSFCMPIQLVKLPISLDVIHVVSSTLLTLMSGSVNHLHNESILIMKLHQFRS